MAFQTQINERPARGIQGDKATLNPCVYTAGNPLAKGAVKVGSFVWASGDGYASNSGAGMPLGFVERNLAFYSDAASGSALHLKDGSALTVARKGDFYAVASTAASAGQKVFATLADGSLQTKAAGASVSDAVETAWTVIDGGAPGELITISNWSE